MTPFGEKDLDALIHKSQELAILWSGCTWLSKLALSFDKNEFRKKCQSQELNNFNKILHIGHPFTSPHLNNFLGNI